MYESPNHSLDELESLPALPSSYRALSAQTDAPADITGQILRVAARDPAVAAEVLRVGSEGQGPFGPPSGSIVDAVSASEPQVLLEHLRGWFAQRQFEPRSNALRSLWHSAVWTSQACRELAARHPDLGLDEEEAATAGLLSDLGRLAFASQDERDYDALGLRVLGEPRGVIREERSRYGFDHQTLGAALARQWGLPPELVRVIRSHHDCDPESQGPLSGAVALAEALLLDVRTMSVDSRFAYQLGQELRLGEERPVMMALRARIERDARPRIRALELEDRPSGNSDAIFAGRVQEPLRIGGNTP